MTNVYRIIDANLNRASEGLRTIEEFARFVLGDMLVSGDLKSLRHSLAEAANRLDRVLLLVARDTGGDVGTTNKTESELQRPTIAAVVVAASQRVQQSLRCLEEYGKMVNTPFAENIESLRYRSYDMLAKIELKALQYLKTNSSVQRASCSHSKLYVLVDCELPIDEFVKRLEVLSHAGVDWIQIRDKQADSRRLVIYSKAAITSLDKSKTQVLVNDRLDIAMAVGAAGVHLGQEDLQISEARRIAPESMWIGVSTHSIAQALDAEAEGADYIGCGPTFPSTTKNFDQYNGVDWLATVAEKVSIPAFAIGGIDASNVERVTQAGIRRVAVNSGVWGSVDPATSARQIREKL